MADKERIINGTIWIETDETPSFRPVVYGSDDIETRLAEGRVVVNRRDRTVS